MDNPGQGPLQLHQVLELEFFELHGAESRGALPCGTAFSPVEFAAVSATLKDVQLDDAFATAVAAVTALDKSAGATAQCAALNGLLQQVPADWPIGDTTEHGHLLQSRFPQGLPGHWEGYRRRLLIEEALLFRLEPALSSWPGWGDFVEALQRWRLHWVYRAIHSLNAVDVGTESALADLVTGGARAVLARIKQHSGRAALCFSGGGIRSATFSLGILQGLQHPDNARGGGALGDFHYLSTVSGGGYIGGWLSAWLARTRQDGKPGEVFRELNSDTGPGEARPIRHLREYSNYLSPRLGLLSADTWALFAIYLRNLGLTWLMLLPAIALLLLIPRMLIGALSWSTDGCVPTAVCLALAGALSLSASVVYAVKDMYSTGSRTGTDGRYLECSGVWMYLGMILLCCAWFVYPCYLRVEFAKIHGLLISAGVLAALHFLASLWGLSRLKSTPVPRGWVLFSGILCGAVVGTALWWLFTTEFLLPEINLAGYVLWSVPAAILIYMAISNLVIGLSSRAPYKPGDYSASTPAGGDERTKETPHEMRREWTARANGWWMIGVVAWVALFGMVFYGPCAFNWITSKLPESLTVGTGGLAGLIATVGAYFAKAPAGGQKNGAATLLKDNALSLAAVVFLVSVGLALTLAADVLLFSPARVSAVYVIALVLGLIVLLRNRRELFKLTLSALTVAWLFAVIAGVVVQWRGIEMFGSTGEIWYLSAHNAQLLEPLGWRLWILFFGVLTLTLATSRAFSVNEFSLNAMYGSRLVRAYLGASNPERIKEQHRFTGFAKEDQCDMAALVPEDGRGATRLYHVINCALNVVGGAEAGGDKLSWQERKAEPFIFSPFHAGDPYLGYRVSSKQWARGRAYGNGISLGRAVAISGAAANPNAGYHSSPLLAFLLTLFNVRLGWWLGNPGPAGWRTYPLDEPIWAGVQLLKELLGQTRDTTAYVNLSDGGHFENLAIYSMVQRRCALIVAVDAGCDPKYEFEDIANAVRKVRIDLGVPIEFVEGAGLNRLSCRGEQGNVPAKACFALARIRYAEADGEGVPDGWLLYVKPTLMGDDTADIQYYARTNKDFPHETTADQFFSESQFESYRRLGLLEASRLWR